MMNTHYTLCTSDKVIGTVRFVHGVGDLLSICIHAPAHAFPALLWHVATCPVTLRAEGGQLGVCHSQGLLLTLGQVAGSYSGRHSFFTYWTDKTCGLLLTYIFLHLILISALNKIRILNLSFSNVQIYILELYK